MDSDEHLAASSRSAAEGASYHILLQISFRLTSFISNAAILRLASQELLGLVNVRLLLLYSTAIFFSREAFIKSCLSFQRNEKNAQKWQRLLNLCWLSPVLAVPIVTFLCWVWIFFLPPPTVPYYNLSVVCYGLSVILTLVSLPCSIVNTINLNVKRKIAAEGVGVALQCFVLLTALLVNPELGLLAACCGQIVRTAVYSIYIVTQTLGDVSRGQHPVFAAPHDMLPASTTEGLPWYRDIDYQRADMTWRFIKNGFFKQLLTEGEKYLMTFVGGMSLSEQGVFDAIQNLGALVARFLFKPLEEVYFTLFASLLSDDQEEGHEHEASSETDTADDKRTCTNASQEHAAFVLATLVKLMALVGAVIAVFGQAYSSLLLHIYGGTTLSAGKGPTLLRLYSAYVFTMSLNGMTEAFSVAGSSARDVEALNFWMLVFSLVFVAAAAALCPWIGAAGLIIANCINMLLRVGRSCFMISRIGKDKPAINTKGSPLWRALPQGIVTASLLVCWPVTEASQSHFLPNIEDFEWRGAAMHVLVGAACLAFVLLGIYLEEMPFLQDVRELLGGRKRDSEERTCGDAASAHAKQE